jgi:hippurate hydrolase
MSGRWRDVIEDATSLRRDLHRRPELTWAETATAATVRDLLTDAGIAWRACADTGTVATLAPAAAGRHVALRADLDAMPIVEQTGAAWTSQVDGIMHACGHDGHVATLIAATRWLTAHADALPGPVTLLFQPAEEGGHGARAMIEGGALDDVDVVFGWHNWPAIGFGRAVCPDGAVMAGNGTFHIELVGVGGHASQPQACRDPVLAAAAVTVALQQVVARRLAPHDAVVVSVSSIDARSAPTVTPERALVEGSIRIDRPGLRDTVNALITSIVQDTARAYGVTATVEHRSRYAATVNHPGPAEQYRGVLADEFGPDWLSDATPTPVMASEDFSYYLAEVPGAFALVGADDGFGHDVACHSPRYDFNDALIDPMARILCRLAGAPPP